MNDLNNMIEKWKDSSLGFLEVEQMINLLIVDNNRLEKANSSLIESLHEIKLMQEDLLGEQCVFSEAWITANEALNNQ